MEMLDADCNCSGMRKAIRLADCTRMLLGRAHQAPALASRQVLKDEAVRLQRHEVARRHLAQGPVDPGQLHVLRGHDEVVCTGLMERLEKSSVA